MGSVTPCPDNSGPDISIIHSFTRMFSSDAFSLRSKDPGVGGGSKRKPCPEFSGLVFFHSATRSNEFGLNRILSRSARQILGWGRIKKKALPRILGAGLFLFPFRQRASSSLGNKKSPSATGGKAFCLSGWQDSNLRPPAPKAGAMTGLRYTPRQYLSSHSLSR